MEVFWTLLQGFAALAFLVGVHEAGHMVAAKLFGMRVEKFSIGFPPKLFGFTKGETEYSLGLIPLGGFVKISGMVDESFDTANLDKEPEPWEFRAKPAWQRLIVMLGGIIVNVVTGVIIFILLTYFVADLKVEADSIPYGLHADSLATASGFRDGDNLVSINGKPVKYFDELLERDFLSVGGTVTVIGEDKVQRDIIIGEDLAYELRKHKGFAFPRRKFVVDSLIPYGKAELAGVKPGDQFIKVGEKSVFFYHEVSKELSEYKEKAVGLTVVRGGDTLVLKSEVNENGHIQVVMNDPFSYDTIPHSFGESIGIGTKTAFSVVIDNVIGFKRLFQGKEKVSESVSGPVGIFSLFGGSFIKFWSLVGLLSMVLAFMNLLPIPALDGGHVIFLLYEMITGRKPSDKFMEISIKIGFAILLTLILFAVGNDIFRLFK